MAQKTRTSFFENARRSARRVLSSVLGAGSVDKFQSLAALAIVAVSSVIAGLILGNQSDRLEELPGLLLMVPAATALRGNVFGALGSRLGTAIHAGTFSLSGSRSTLVGQNIWASAVLALGLSTVIAALSKLAASVFGVADAMALDEFIVISVVGGVTASVIVLSITLVLSAGSVRFGWDPDNVTAPLVTASGDLVTLPALMIAASLVGNRGFTVSLATGLVTFAVAALVLALRSKYRQLRSIVLESLPVLGIAAVGEVSAGVAVERQLEKLAELPELLVVLPGFLAAAGALGGILSSRLSTKFHLGLIRNQAVPDKVARGDIGAIFGLALPIFAFAALASHIGAGWLDLAGPGLDKLLMAVLIGGLVATFIVVVVAYYGTATAVRFGLDPDTYGIPMVSSVLDLTGALTFVIAVQIVIFT